MTSEQEIKTSKIKITYQDIINGTPSDPGNLGRLVFIGKLDCGDEIISSFINVKEGFILPEGADITASVVVDSLPIVLGTIRSAGVVNDKGVSSKFYVLSFSSDKDIELRVEAGSNDVSELTAGEMNVYVNYIKH